MYKYSYREDEWTKASSKEGQAAFGLCATAGDTKEHAVTCGAYCLWEIVDCGLFCFVCFPFCELSYWPVAMGEKGNEKVRVDRVDGIRLEPFGFFAWAAVHAKFGRQFYVTRLWFLDFVLNNAYFLIY